MKYLLFLTSLLILTACKITPDTQIPEGKVCGLKIHNIEFPLDPDDLKYRDQVSKRISDGAQNVLYLSGGGQHGAFGAGFLDEWRIINNKIDFKGQVPSQKAREYSGLPPFDIVTGVSTGALLSTPAFIGETEVAVSVATIETEEEILKAFVSGDDFGKKIPIEVIYSLMTKGAFSDLEGLRSLLHKTITPEMLNKVAEKSSYVDEDGKVKERKLFVGATDFDSGGAVAFDMTDLAQRYSVAKSLQEKNVLKSCYVESLIASSSVPGAAKPVFIDNRMFIDGGIRFTVFSDDIGKQIRQQFTARSGPKRVFVVMNSDLETKKLCGKEDPELCKLEAEDAYLYEGERKAWGFDGLAGRTIDLLADQVGRFSVRKATELEKSASTVELISIDRIVKDNHPFEYEGKTKTCDQWRTLDKDTENPIQFHPYYMKCLIDYGRSVARNEICKLEESGRSEHCKE